MSAVWGYSDSNGKRIFHFLLLLCVLALCSLLSKLLHRHKPRKIERERERDRDRDKDRDRQRAWDYWIHVVFKPFLPSLAIFSLTFVSSQFHLIFSFSHSTLTVHLPIIISLIRMHSFVLVHFTFIQLLHFLTFFHFKLSWFTFFAFVHSVDVLFMQNFVWFDYWFNLLNLIVILWKKQTLMKHDMIW